jgi:hypothetical protein
MEPTDDLRLRGLLREWQVEDPPPALDARVLGRTRAPAPAPAVSRRTSRMRTIASGARKTMLAAAILGMGAFLIVVTQAVPQTLKLVSSPLPVPYRVDSEYLRYADDGSQTVEMYSTSYTNQNGREVLLERTIADHPLGTAFGRTLDAVTGFGSSRELEKEKYGPERVGVISGCSPWTCLTLSHWFFRRAEGGADAPCVAGRVVGRDTILGYPATAVQLPLPNQRATSSRPAAARITMWMAPDLGCFALRIWIEEQQPDGTFRLVSTKQALRVTVEPRDSRDGANRGQGPRR